MAPSQYRDQPEFAASRISFSPPPSQISISWTRRGRRPALGLTLDSAFTIKRFRAAQESDNPIFLAGKEHIIEGMRKAGVPEGGAKSN